MSQYKSPLDSLKVASPCSMAWNEMYGDDRKRFCGECRLNVYDLSGMTRQEAENLLVTSEGRLCVRYYKRSDGTVLTKDCPVGWAKVRQRLSVYTTAAFAMLMSFFTGVFFVSLLGRGSAVTRHATITASPKSEQIMGAIALPPVLNKNRSGAAEAPPDVERYTVGRIVQQTKRN